MTASKPIATPNRTEVNMVALLREILPVTSGRELFFILSGVMSYISFRHIPPA
jgi:hypothetical protein